MNLLSMLPGLPGVGSAERFDALLSRPGLRIERVVSQGQASPAGFWYDQTDGKWVLVLAGAARLRFEDETDARLLGPGDWVDIDPHRRHRVDWTDPAVALLPLTTPSGVRGLSPSAAFLCGWGAAAPGTRVRYCR